MQNAKFQKRSKMAAQGFLC